MSWLRMVPSGVSCLLNLNLLIVMLVPVLATCLFSVLWQRHVLCGAVGDDARVREVLVPGVDG